MYVYTYLHDLAQTYPDSNTRSIWCIHVYRLHKCKPIYMYMYTYSYDVAQTYPNPRTRSVTWLIDMCDMTYSYVCHDDMWHDSCMIEHKHSLIHIQNLYVVYTCIYIFICICLRIHTIEHQYSPIHIQDLRHDSFICVTWLTQMCDMTHS